MANDEKKKKGFAPIDLEDMESAFSDDDALAAAINSALEDADKALDAKKAQAESDEPQAPAETDTNDESGAASEIIEVDDEIIEIDAPPPIAPAEPQAPPARPAAAKPESRPERPKTKPEKPQPAAKKAPAAPPKGQGLVDLEEQPPQSAEADEMYERLLRVMAEFENFRKRAAKEKQEFQRFAAENVLSDFLPVLDNFERAIESCEQSRDVDSLLDGIRMIHRQLRDVMKHAGVRSFESIGQRFDPNKHQAVQLKATREREPGTVVAEFQKGYFIHERLMRPAMVVVAKEPEPGELLEDEPEPDLPMLGGDDDVEDIEELIPIEEGDELEEISDDDEVEELDEPIVEK